MTPPIEVIAAFAWIALAAIGGTVGLFIERLEAHIKELYGSNAEMVETLKGLTLECIAAGLAVEMFVKSAEKARKP